jgi:outer membrane protein assembly factor BamA
MRKAAKFPVGKDADWKRITTEALRMETVLQSDGYLRVSSTADRGYRKNTQIVDVTIHVNKGPQFRFGALQVNGLNPEATQSATKLWKIAEGEPLDGLYIDEYLKAAFKGPAKGSKSVRKELKLRPGTTVMDVVVNFK